MNRMTIYLTRGTAQQHEEFWREVPPGNFTLVTDRPELRFHDGATPGGLVIPIPPEALPAIRAAYAAREAWVDARRKAGKPTQ